MGPWFASIPGVLQGLRSRTLTVESVTGKEEEEEEEEAVAVPGGRLRREQESAT